MLIYRCPTTAKVLHSSIETCETEVRRLSDLRLSLWCPPCQGGHSILARATQIIADIMP
jgi:hypothetical protein